MFGRNKSAFESWEHFVKLLLEGKSKRKILGALQNVLATMKDKEFLYNEKKLDEFNATYQALANFQNFIIEEKWDDIKELVAKHQHSIEAVLKKIS